MNVLHGKHLCSRCGNPCENSQSRHCRDCHASYMREWRKRQSPMKRIGEILNELGWPERLRELADRVEQLGQRK